VDLSFSTGIAEMLYNVTSTATDETDGTLPALIDQLETTNSQLEEKSDDIREQAETYRTNITNRYAEYQAAISEAEDLLDYLTTLLETWNSSS
jgi:flagellar hook-associated protein 2